MKKQTITISCYKPGNTRHMSYSLKPLQEIEVQIEAYVYGGLGLHKCLVNNSLYTLTHIKSGMSINSYKMRKEQAIQWLVDAARLTDWTEDVSFLSSETAKHILEIALMARRIVQESEQAS